MKRTPNGGGVADPSRAPPGQSRLNAHAFVPFLANRKLRPLRYPVGAPTLGGFHVGRDFAAKAVWLVGGGSDCRHGARARRVRASRGADCRHGASAITKARAAHGAANAAPRSSCRAGLPARRSSRRDVNSLPTTGSPQGRPRLLGGVEASAARGASAVS